MVVSLSFHLCLRSEGLCVSPAQCLACILLTLCWTSWVGYGRDQAGQGPGSCFWPGPPLGRRSRKSWSPMVAGPQSSLVLLLGRWFPFPSFPLSIQGTCFQTSWAHLGFLKFCLFYFLSAVLHRVAAQHNSHLTGGRRSLSRPALA